MPVVSVLGFIGAGAFVAWTIRARPTDVYITHEVADSFNLEKTTDPVRVPAAAVEAVSAAAAPSSLVKPVADPMMASSARKAEAAPPRTVISPKAEAWAMRQTAWAGLLAKPAAFLMARGGLGSARGVRAFLGDPKKVDAYMDSPLVRVALNSPGVAKALLGSTSLVSAFLATPALNDPQTVQALLASPMLRKMLDCPAVKEALSDQATLRKMLGDPKTLAWVAAHPGALLAVADAAPDLVAAVNAKR